MRKFSLQTIHELCRKLGNPERKVKAVHIAGTNGKGAVAAMMEVALRARGLSVGRYTSPHLVKENERFFLNGTPIDDKTLKRISRKVEQLANAKATFFEKLTAIAFKFYADNKVDFSIMECGLGGRLDATNIANSAISIITRIGLDHCDWLGKTITKIAGEKAGIIKRGVPVVLGENVPAVRRVIERKAREMGAPFYYAPKVVKDLALPQTSLKGEFNRENEITALAALKVLTGSTEGAEAFNQVVWPGRFQRIGRFIIDGAHNPPAAEALVKALKLTGIKQVSLIAGFCGDKDIAKVLKTLAPFVKKGYGVKTVNPRAVTGEYVAQAMCKAGIDAEASSLSEALNKSKGITLVCGSLFLVGEALLKLNAYPWGKASTIDPSEGESLALVSLGCAKNAVDLQVMVGNLLAKGDTLSTNPDQADTIIINTCSFIESARKEAEAEIKRALKLKAQGKYRRVIVTGCYPERYPNARFPGVDEWIGVPKTWIEPKLPALRFTGKAFAYLKIAEGCAHRCAYCAIPNIRGSYRSRPMADILKEAKALLKSGCRELNIVAQDPMLWREDKKTLVDLLKAIDRLPGKFWLRVLYSYPSEISADFVLWMMKSKHAVHYIDVPLQHTVPEILARMNRKAAIPASLSATEVLREVIPDLTLRTTIMTGFPGENEAHFKRLKADIRRMQFDHLGAFAFSPEKGTSAMMLGGKVARKVAERRECEIMREQAAIWRVKARLMVGKFYEALVVAPNIARMSSQAPEVDGVTFVNSTKVGEFIKVKLTKVKGFDFVGEVVE